MARSEGFTGQDSLGELDLIPAIAWNKVETVKKLLEMGISPNTTRSRSFVDPPAYIGKDIPLKDFNGTGSSKGDALYVAVKYDRLPLVRLLLEYGADVNASGSRDCSLLQMAIESEGRTNIELAKILLEHGADVDFQDSQGRSVTQFAAARGRVELVQLLLDHGANVNVQGGIWSSALGAATWHDRLDIVRILLDHGADSSLQPIDTRHSLLHEAVESNNLDILVLLYERGADVHLETMNDEGLTPLHAAVIMSTSRGNMDCVKYLLEKGASPDVADLSGNSPMHTALQSENAEMVALLYERSSEDTVSLSATALRDCANVDKRCTIEVTSGQERRLVCREPSLLSNRETILFMFPSQSHEYGYEHPGYIQIMLQYNTRRLL